MAEEQHFQKRDEVYFIVNKYIVPPSPSPPGKPFPPKVSHLFATLPGRTTSKTFPSSRHIDNSTNFGEHRAFRSFFLITKKTIRQTDRLCMKIS